MRRVILATVLLLAVALASVASAQAPATISYQGRLTNASGTPITTATTVAFSIFAAASGGSALWTESQSVTPDAQGFFTAELGASTTFPSNLTTDGAKKYLELNIGGTPLTPRQLITSTLYAQRATVASAAGTAVSVMANGVNTAAVADNAVTAAKIAPNVVSSISGVSNDGGDVALAAGSGISVTPNDAANTVTIGTAVGGMHPIAFAIVNTDGTLRASSGNISSLWNAASQWYELAINGVTFDLWHHFAMVQQIGVSRNYYATTDGGGAGKLLVRVHDNTGASVQFYFEVMVYDLPGLAKSGQPATVPAGMTQSEAAAQAR